MEEFKELTRYDLIDRIMCQKKLIDMMTELINNHEKIDKNNKIIIDNLEKINVINSKKIELLVLQLRNKDLIISSLEKMIYELNGSKEEGKAKEID